MLNISKRDSSLLDKCISGDKKAWDHFVDRFSGLIYHSLSQTLQNAAPEMELDQVSDLMHLVFVRLMENNYKKLRQFQGKCSLASWIRMISIRTAVDFLRKSRGHLSLQGDTEREKMLAQTLREQASSAEELLQEKDRRRIFIELQNNLTSREKLFVELHYTRELAPRQVAHIMGTSVGAIYTMKNRVRDKLKDAAKEFL